MWLETAEDALEDGDDDDDDDDEQVKVSIPGWRQLNLFFYRHCPKMVESLWPEESLLRDLSTLLFQRASGEQSTVWWKGWALLFLSLRSIFGYLSVCW